LLLGALMIAMPAAGHAAVPDGAAAKARIDAALDRDYPGLEKLYRDIHAHPELAFQEQRTAALLADTMRKLGFDVTEKVGKTGIVALYRNGSGPTVLVRTELDGLPMQEKTGLPYASTDRQTVDGKESFTAHSCGHDIHMAWWVGTAEALLAMKDRWHGTLMFVGQPAEERAAGAHAMLEDGLFRRFPKPDYGFAAHVGNAAAGTVSVKDGVVSSASDSIELVFHGRGGHGSMPSATIDPIVMGAHFVSDVQTVISRQKDAGAFGVITVGSFQAGSVANIIPDDATLKLTLRSFSPEVRTLLLDGVAHTAKAVADMAGAPAPEIRHLSGTSAVMNDSKLARETADMLKAVIGDRVSFVPASMPGGTASEDYAEFIAAGVPSVYFGIGGYDPATIADDKARGIPVPVNHSPTFAPVPEPSIRAGVTTLALSVLMVAGTETAR
jgi:hippurate hydrolase